MGEIEKILTDIKNVKIQGATNVAKAGIKAFLIAHKKNKQKNLKKIYKKITSVRPTEPLLQNSLKILLKSKNPKKESEKILKYIKKSKEKIASFGAKKIKKEMNVFSHCHSSTVIEILKLAKKKKKKFVVYTPEVEPLLQGRTTAKELSKSKINVIVVPDLAVEHALKKCDLLLFGADAITKKGVVNKIGTSTICKLAKELKIPRYACTNSLKYTRRVSIEKRTGREVWDERNKKIEILNPAFDLVNKKFITGIISENGVTTHKQFIKKAKQKIKKFLK